MPPQSRASSQASARLERAKERSSKRSPQGKLGGVSEQEESPDAKAKLLECMAPGNVEKTRAAPVTAILAMHMEFHESLPKLFPHTDARSWFAGNQPYIESTAFRNSSIQGGYFILAARALGLDCGPMSGFDAEKVDGAFFAGRPERVNFLCNLGYGDASTLHPRSPRFEFDEACEIA